MIKKVFPAPILSLLIFFFWLLLNTSLNRINLSVAIILALLIPIYTAELRPNKVSFKKTFKFFRLLAVVFYDMIVSNWRLMKCILRKATKNNPQFVRLPLELKDTNALAVLAVIVCFTPGTAWAEISFDRSVLLIHCINLADESDLIALIKTRYEQPLKEIFE